MGLKLILFIPLIEIVLFILFGDLFGFFQVILAIIISIVVGLWLLLPKNKVENIQKIGIEPVDWICKRIAGIFLIIPGFLTDTMGILLLIKSMRPLLWLLIPGQLKKFTSSFTRKQGFKQNNKKDENQKIIDAEYKDLDD